MRLGASPRAAAGAGGGTGTAGGVIGTAGAGTWTAGVWAMACVNTGAMKRGRRGTGRMGDRSAPDTVSFKVPCCRLFLGLELFATSTLFLKGRNSG